MDVGIMGVTVRRQPGDTRPLKELYREAVDTAPRCEQKGYDFFMNGEHHFMEDQWNPSPLMVLAAMSQRTSAIRLMNNVLLAPMYHPVRLAEDAATLDLLSNGRFEFCAGTGSVRGEFETLGLDADARVGATREVLQLVSRALNSAESFDFNGKHYQYPNIRMTTQPVQKPFPVWFGGGGDQNQRWCARNGFHLFLNGRMTPDAYIEAMKECGRDINDYNLGICFVTIVVVEKESEIEEAKEKLDAAGRAQVADYSRTRDLQRRVQTTQRPHYHLGGAIGTPDMVLRALEPQFKDGPYTHITGGGAGSNEALFVKEVMPVLKTWGRQPVKTKAEAKA